MKDKKAHTIKNNLNELIVQFKMINNRIFILNIKNGVMKCLKTSIKYPL